MKYAIAFYHADGTINHDIARSAMERNMWLNDARQLNINAVTYNPIYKSGEYGKRTCVVFNRG